MKTLLETWLLTESNVNWKKLTLELKDFIDYSGEIINSFKKFVIEDWERNFERHAYDMRVHLPISWKLLNPYDSTYVNMIHCRNDLDHEFKLNNSKITSVNIGKFQIIMNLRFSSNIQTIQNNLDYKFSTKDNFNHKDVLKTSKQLSDLYHIFEEDEWLKKAATRYATSFVREFNYVYQPIIKA